MIEHFRAEVALVDRLGHCRGDGQPWIERNRIEIRLARANGGRSFLESRECGAFFFLLAFLGEGLLELVANVRPLKFLEGVELL
jgi:hypothetical protein